MTEKTPLIDPNLRALAEEALDLWQDYLDSCTSDPKVKTEMAQMMQPMQQMFAPWAQFMQQSMDTARNAQNSMKTAAQQAQPQAAPEEPLAQQAEAQSQATPNEPVKAPPTSHHEAKAHETRSNHNPHSQTAAERRMAELESRIAELESYVAKDVDQATAEVHGAPDGSVTGRTVP